MVKINFSELTLDHVVEFTVDNTVFACAKLNDTGHLRLFLIFDNGTGHVYTRNGRADSWEELYGHEAEVIRSKVYTGRNNHIPVYKINGSGNLTTGGSHNN